MKTKAPQEYWDRTYHKTQFAVAPEGHTLRRWIEAWVPPDPHASAFEVGCYPGRFLAVLGERGYELNGIDTMDDVGEMADWMRSQGYRVGAIAGGDFFDVGPERRFDVVLSLGFI